MSSLNLKALGPCLLAIAIDAMGFGLVYPIMSALFADPHAAILAQNTSTHWRIFMLGLGYGIYPFFMFFGSSLMGALSDRYGRRKILLVCVFGLSISYFLMAYGALLPNVYVLLVGRGMSGLMAGCQGIAQAAVSDVSTPENKAYNMSLMSLAFSAGVIVGPICGGVLSDSSIAPGFNYGTPFLLVGIIALGCGIWTAMAYRDTAVLSPNTRVDIWLPVRILHQAAKHKRIAFLSLVFFLMQIGYGLYLQTITMILQTRFQYTTSKLGLFSGVIGVSFTVGLLFVVRRMIRIWNVNDIAKMGLLIAGTCEILSALFPNERVLWFLATLIGCFDMVAYTTILTAFSDAVSKARQGWALGVAGSVMALAWVFTGFLTNLLPVIGGTGLLLVGGVSFLASCAVMWVYLRYRSPPSLSRPYASPPLAQSVADLPPGDSPRSRK